MAARGEELNTRITATDEASTVVDRVAAKVGDLEDGTHDVSVGAKDEASDDIAEVAGKLDRLTKEDRQIVLSARADQLEREVANALKKLRNFENLDGDTINVIIDAKDKATDDLRRIRKELADLDGETASVGANLTDAFGSLESLGVSTGKLGQLFSGGGGVAAGVGAVVGGLIAAADHAADLAIEAQNLSTLTGDSVEQASRLNAVWKQTGAETKDLQDVMLQMNGVLQTTPDLAAKLGINTADGASIGARFEQVAAALDKIPDAAQRSQLASQLFGEEGVRQYNALKNSVGDLATALENVPSGSVFTEDDVERARETKAQITELKTEFEAFANSMGTVVLPAMGAVVGGLNDLFDGAEKAGQGLRRFFDAAADANFKHGEATDDAIAKAEQASLAILKGASSFQEARAAALAYGESLGISGDYVDLFANKLTTRWNENKQAAAELTERNNNWNRSLGESATATDAATDALEQHRKAIDDAVDSIDDLISKNTRLVGGEFAVRDAQREAKDAAKELNDELATGKLTMQEAQVAIDDAAESQLAAADAATQYRLDQMRARGETVNAKTEQILLKEELQKLADQATGPLHDAIMAMITDLEAIPSQKKVDIIVTSGGRPVALGGSTLRGGTIIVDDYAPRVPAGSLSGGSQAVRPVQVSFAGANFYGNAGGSPMWTRSLQRDLERIARGAL